MSSLIGLLSIQLDYQGQNTVFLCVLIDFASEIQITRKLTLKQVRINYVNFFKYLELTQEN